MLDEDLGWVLHMDAMRDTVREARSQGLAVRGLVFINPGEGGCQGRGGSQGLAVRGLVFINPGEGGCQGWGRAAGCAGTAWCSSTQVGAHVAFPPAHPPARPSARWRQGHGGSA